MAFGKMIQAARDDIVHFAIEYNALTHRIGKVGGYRRRLWTVFPRPAVFAKH